MFTGIIESIGSIRALTPKGGDVRDHVETGKLDLSDVKLGDSIAVNGVCLTATTVEVAAFSAMVSPETLRVTSFGEATSGRLVNLERPLRADGRIGGHFVLAHVDAVGRITDLRPDGECYWLEIEFPSALAPLLVSKGSVAVDGVSLTIAALEGRRFGVQIVPHTWAHTAVRASRLGEAVNLEADVIGKYVARLLDAHWSQPTLAEALATPGGGSV